MHDLTDILFTLFIVFVAAQVGAEVAGRLTLPAVVGEIAAGCLIGLRQWAGSRSMSR